MKTQKLVTRESLQAMLESTDTQYVNKVVGRALVVIFNNQTLDERSANTTNRENGTGFTGADARSGTLTAKSFLKNGTLQDWAVERWTKRASNGFSRLTKYHAQLNEAAIAKKVTQ